MSKWAEGSYWFYAPNKVAPIIFCVLFAISVRIHWYQNSKYQWWKPLFVLIWAGIVNIAGLAVREAGAFHYNNLKLYIASATLLFAGPPIYQAANYIILGRILYYIPYLAPLHPGRVLTTFLGLDAIIEALTVNGMIRLSNKSLTPSTIKTGGNLVKAGILMQQGACVLFLAVAVYFHIRCVKRGVCTPNLRTVLFTLYASTGLIIIRGIYATVITFEAVSKDHLGPFIKNEVVFWLMDVTVMLVNTYLWNLLHPAKFLPRDHKVYLSTDGRTELLGPGFLDKRSFIVTLLDPFDIVGLLRGKHRKNVFWDQPGQPVAAEQGARDEESAERKEQPIAVQGRGAEGTANKTEGR